MRFLLQTDDSRRAPIAITYDQASHYTLAVINALGFDTKNLELLYRIQTLFLKKIRGNLMTLPAQLYGLYLITWHETI